MFFRAAEDLDVRRKRPLQPRNPTPLELHFRHLIGTDPATAVVADDGGRIVAFGISSVRGATWFLSFLFVAPEWQARGLGRAVFAECLSRAGSVERRATCTEADQPVSTGLYASLGMAPRLPLYVLRGALNGEALPLLPTTLRTRPIEAAAVADLDDSLLGYRRPQDHAFWAQHERRGWMFESHAGELLGYGYAQPSGRVGPVAVIDQALLLPFVGHLVRSTQVLEGWQLIVPGPAIAALQPLLQAGLRIDGSPAVYCADGATPSFDRYLPGSFGLL
ncbi:MAG: GNAT family N-acetyltransferase [Chloroflexota bacterium]